MSNANISDMQKAENFDLGYFGAFRRVGATEKVGTLGFVFMLNNVS